MANARDVVQGYQRALGKGDWAGARGYLENNLSFKGPFDTFDKADAHLEAIRRSTPSRTGSR